MMRTLMRNEDTDDEDKDDEDTDDEDKDDEDKDDEDTDDKNNAICTVQKSHYPPANHHASHF